MLRIRDNRVQALVTANVTSITLNTVTFMKEKGALTSISPQVQPPLVSALAYIQMKNTHTSPQIQEAKTLDNWLTVSPVSSVCSVPAMLSLHYISSDLQSPARKLLIFAPNITPYKKPGSIIIHKIHRIFQIQSTKCNRV